MTGSIKSAVMLCQLFYWHGKQRDEQGWIYKNQAEWEEETGLVRSEQETARRILRDKNLIEEKYEGMPRRLYFRLNMDAINAEWLKLTQSMRESDSEKVTQSLPESYTQPVSFTHTELDHEHRCLRGGEGIIPRTESTTENTTKNNNVGPPKKIKEVVDYLNHKAGTKYKHTADNTRKLISARYNEGFILEDFMAVIDYKVSEWKGNEKMKPYLRPATLFSGKMDWYLNQSQQANSSKGRPKKTFK